MFVFINIFFIVVSSEPNCEPYILYFAAKFEECENNIPKISDLNRFAGPPGFSSRQYLEAEVKMLEFFGWNVNLPTAAHFYDYYLVKAVTSEDIYNGRYLGDEAALAVVSMSKYVIYFLEVSLQGELSIRRWTVIFKLGQSS